MALTAAEEKVTKAIAQRETLAKKTDAINKAANIARAAKQVEIENIETQRATDLAVISALLAPVEVAIDAEKDVVAPK